MRDDSAVEPDEMLEPAGRPDLEAESGYDADLGVLDDDEVEDEEEEEEEDELDEDDDEDELEEDDDYDELLFADEEED